jgi:hypothetical protein
MHFIINPKLDNFSLVVTALLIYLCNIAITASLYKPNWSIIMEPPKAPLDLNVVERLKDNLDS